ncbi:hypothetical protein ACLB2K_044498 [Fragaria x ananassa]
MNATIKEFWCDTGWNIPLLKSVLPDHVVMQIISVPSGFGVSGHDKLIWNATANGKFSVKSAYNSFFDSVGVSNPLWTHLWKLNCPPKLKTFMCAQSKASMQSMFSYTMFSWCKPPENFYKLNIDGSRSFSSGCIGANGVLRDHLGIWIDGFQVNLGIGEVLDAEAWGLFFGLRMVAMHNIVNLEIESDSAVLVQLMLKSDIGVHPFGSLLDSCSVMMSKLLNVNIKHIFRECNIYFFLIRN